MRLPVSGRSRVALLAARALGVLAVLCWGWYIVAMFRTQQFGFSVSILGAATVFVLPAAFLPFVGLRWRALTLGAAATLLAAVGVAEAFAAAEESSFHREHRAVPPDAAVVFQERQWPFAHHYMYYDPRWGHWGGGD